MPSKKIKLLNILNKLAPLDTTESVFKPIEDEMQGVLARVKETIEAKTLDEANERFRKLQESFKLGPLISSIETLKEELAKREASILKTLQDRLAVLNSSFKDIQEMSSKEIENKGKEIAEIKLAIKELSSREFPDFVSIMDMKLSDSEKRFKSMVSVLETQIKDKSELQKIEKKINTEISGIIDNIKTLERDFFARLARVGGGNANRNIAIGGNTSALSAYTDINLKAGNNVTITYSKNNTTKYTDVTITATGGGGSVGGVVRNIETITTSQTGGNADGTDYVYICSAGVRLTLPTASANTNLYTIKNTSASSVLVSPDGTDTIDTDSELILRTQYTAVDLISDGTGNWNIT